MIIFRDFFCLSNYLTVVVIYIITASMDYNVCGLRNSFVPISTNSNPVFLVLSPNALGSDNELQ